VKIAGVETGKRVAVVGCKHTTLELILGLERNGYLIDHVITLDPQKGEDQKVAGYLDLRPFLTAKGIPFTLVNKYAMKSAEDTETMLALKLDALLVMGWQRLIPDWFLQELSVGAFGMHGSSKPLPHGRGRSPMNWSLIQNKDRFYTHLFRYHAGVDDGDIVAVQIFDITQFDTCLTLHYKNTLSMIRLVSENLPSLLAATCEFIPQPTEGATYYPKRSEEDGLVYWSDSSHDIYNLVRAVTKPFAGAFSYLNDDPAKKIVVWRGIPFDRQLEWPAAKPGEIAAVFDDGQFIVRTGDSTFLVQESEGVGLSYTDVGSKLGHLDTPRKVWEDLPE
jgi:methionyl-tRNA formyltransferase